MLVIKNWEGRLGNQLIQLRNAIQISLYYGFNIIFPYCPFFNDCKILFHTRPTKKFYFTPHNFFLQHDIKKKDCFSVNYEKTKNILMRTFKINYNNLKPLENNSLVIHIRSGDLFLENPLPNTKRYISPPFSYYTKIIESNNYENIYIISENTRNPIINLLLKKFTNIKFKVQTIIEDIKLIMRAANIIISIGSFVPNILYLTNHTKKIYTTHYNSKRHLNKNFLNNDIKIEVFKMQNYYKKQGHWKNLKRQVDLMINYDLINEEEDTH